MKIYKQLRKRGLALFMALVMCLSLLPVSAMAAESAPEESNGIAASVEYPTPDRSSAEITYQRPGTPTNTRLICLVDVSRYNKSAAQDVKNAADALRNVYLDSLTAAQLNGDEQKDSKVIPYTTSASVCGFGTGFTYGQGQSNTAAGLQKAIEAVQNAASDNTVVLWVPAASLEDARNDGYTDELIIQKLEELKAALDSTGGTLVTWQKTAQADELLTEHAGDVHTATDDFLDKVQADMESILAPHIQDFALKLETPGPLAQSIVSVETNLGTVVGDTLRIDKLYDYQELNFTVTVKLDTSVKTDADVAILTPSLSGKCSAGSLGETAALPEFLPAMGNRTVRTITFDLDGIDAREALPGQLVTLPDASGWNTQDQTFSGWWDGATPYDPNGAFLMPDHDVTMTAQWGHVEIELRLGDVTRSTPTGTQMYEPEKGQNTALSFGNEYDSRIKSIRFSPNRVSFAGTAKYGEYVTVNDAEKAKYVGVDADNQVIAYLMGRSDGGYNMIVAGDGKVTAPANCGYLFSGARFSNLEEVDVTWLDTSKATKMDAMFYGCKSLTELDLSSFDVSNVTTMDQMFTNCSLLENLNLSNFDTSSVTDMGAMFRGCKALANLDLSGFNTSKVTNMAFMFGSCEKLTELNYSSFDTSNVTNMERMFYACKALTSLDLSSFNTSSVKNMGGCLPNVIR